MSTIFTIPSDEIDDLISTKDIDCVMDAADGTCTTGYDNDGSTGEDIFENGVRLGMNAVKTNSKIFYIDNDDVAMFFLNASEEDLKLRIEALPDAEEDEEDESEDDE